MELVNAMSILNRVHFFVHEQTNRIRFQTAVNPPFEISGYAEIVNLRYWVMTPSGRTVRLICRKLLNKPLFFGTGKGDAL
ncbi:MAG: hypothetical protein RL214_395 [Pseudomonadota bacterium]